MKTPWKRVLYWAPRVLGILFALFLGMFALDVFGMEGSVWVKIGGFLLHLIPVYLILIALAIAWRWEWIGGLLFLAITAWFEIRYGGQDNWTTNLLLGLPPLLIGLLFLVSWQLRRQLKAGV